uniref:uncharacterized protein LOC131108303 n=1 Tax=Doryrhamphus excisus TaxID=161450 RepID=UPI0025ADD863|nr:uncharacterized protein LOC131108303 [Doryrhamphus excisus]
MKPPNDDLAESDFWTWQILKAMEEECTKFTPEELEDMVWGPDGTLVPMAWVHPGPVDDTPAWPRHRRTSRPPPARAPRRQKVKPLSSVLSHQARTQPTAHAVTECWPTSSESPLLPMQHEEDHGARSPPVPKPRSLKGSQTPAPVPSCVTAQVPPVPKPRSLKGSQTPAPVPSCVMAQIPPVPKPRSPKGSQTPAPVPSSVTARIPPVPKPRLRPLLDLVRAAERAELKTLLQVPLLPSLVPHPAAYGVWNPPSEGGASRTSSASEDAHHTPSVECGDDALCGSPEEEQPSGPPARLSSEDRGSVPCVPAPPLPRRDRSLSMASAGPAVMGVPQRSPVPCGLLTLQAALLRGPATLADLRRGLASDPPPVPPPPIPLGLWTFWTSGIRP